MSKIVWDWYPSEFSPPFTVRYGEGLDCDEYGNQIQEDEAATVSVMANAPSLYHQGGKWFVVSMYDLPKGHRRTAVQALKLLVEQRWHEYINETEQENQS